MDTKLLIRCMFAFGGDRPVFDAYVPPTQRWSMVCSRQRFGHIFARPLWDDVAETCEMTHQAGWATVSLAPQKALSNFFSLESSGSTRGFLHV